MLYSRRVGQALHALLGVAQGSRGQPGSRTLALPAILGA
jgi:hypothetical protein